MKNEELRNRLMQELWKMNRMDIIVHLMEFVEGETAVLGHLVEHGGQTVNPSHISDDLHISRARTANILRALREKGRISMEIDDEDRRKMHVEATPEGRAYYEEKLSFIAHYFDVYIDVIGEDDIRELIRLLEKTVASEGVLKEKHLIPEGKI